MRNLLADLDLVCERCDALAAPRTPTCPRCGAGLLGDDSPLAPPTAEPPAASLSAIDVFRRSDAELVLLRGTAEPGLRFRIPPEGATLGRRQAAFLLSGDPSLSPLAASFAYRNEVLFVRAEASASPVFLRIRDQVALEPGSLFALGDHLLRVGAILSGPPGPERAGIQGAPYPGDRPLLRLETVLGGGRLGRSYLLPSPVRIGRREGEVILANDRFVSGRHCALYGDGGRVILEDLQSSNGTFVPLPPGEWRPLRRGDTLRLGQNILRVR